MTGESSSAVVDGGVAPSPQGVTLSARSRHPLLDRGRPLGRAVRLALVAAALVLAVVVKVPLCPFALVVRQPCPGCGLTRATLALLAGDLHEAAHFHPLVFVVTPVVAIMFSFNAVQYVRRGEWFASEKVSGRAINTALILLGVAMVSLWIARFLGAFGGPVPV